MNKIFSFFKNHELIIRITLSVLLFLTFFMPFFTVANKSIDGEIGAYRSFSMFNTWKIYGQYFGDNSFSEVVRVIYKHCGFSLFLPFILSIFSIFGYKKRIFNIIEKITSIVFILFYTEIFLWCFVFGQYADSNYSIIPQISFFIWTLIFVMDCIYLFTALYKAYPFNFSKRQNPDERIAELEKRISELESTKKD